MEAAADGADAPDGHEARRVEAAGALRRLLHAFVGHDADDATLLALHAETDALTARLQRGAPRDRMTLMRRASAGANPFADPATVRRAGFEDRAVAGRANPTSVVFDVRQEGDAMVTDVRLEAAFEGAPGRAHGGIVAAVFDDFTGTVIAMLHEPAFTGELTVRFVRPVPVLRPLRFRAWLEGREGRKLDIRAEARDGDEIVATCRAVYVTVDPSVFARTPDPR